MFLASNLRNVFFLVALGVGSVGCRNALQDFSDKSSDAYRIVETKKLMDQLNFTGAIATIEPVLGTRPTDPNVRYLASAAYAGRAGLRVLNLLIAIPQDIGAIGLLHTFAEHFTLAGAAEVADIAIAVDIVEDYSDVATERSRDLNFYMLFLYYARIGAILNRYALDSAKLVRTNFSACEPTSNFSNSLTGIPDADIDTIMITLPRIVETAAQVTSDGSGTDSVIGTDLGALLGVSIPRVAIPCATASSAANITACQAVRSLVNRGPLVAGIGLDTPGDLAGGVCVP